MSYVMKVPSLRGCCAGVAPVLRAAAIGVSRAACRAEARCGKCSAVAGSRTRSRNRDGRGARDVIPQTPHAAATMPQLRVVHVGAEVTHLTSDAYAHQHDSDAGLAAAVCCCSVLARVDVMMLAERSLWNNVDLSSDRRMQPLQRALSRRRCSMRASERACSKEPRMQQSAAGIPASSRAQAAKRNERSLGSVLAGGTGARVSALVSASAAAQRVRSRNKRPPLHLSGIAVYSAAASRVCPRCAAHANSAAEVSARRERTLAPKVRRRQSCAQQALLLKPSPPSSRCTRPSTWARSPWPEHCRLALRRTARGVSRAAALNIAL
jgi:hypothetical protein